MFQDKTLVCKDCAKDFIFSASEQEFYATKGFQNDPARCKPCRDLKKHGSASASENRVKTLFDAVCDQCGKEAKVPFKPRLQKPVFCSECFENAK